jgi:F-type H+-transporting ATPase subunit b
MRLPSLRRAFNAPCALVLSIASVLPATAAHASEAGEGGPVNLLEPNAGLMVWTLVIFIGLLFVLKQFAFKPLFAAVEERERSLTEAIEGAKRDRDAAAALLVEHKAQLDAGRAQAQQLIADGRSVSEKMRAEMLEDTRKQQAEMLEQARRDIAGETAKAIAELRLEAVDLAIAGAGKVIEQNLDSAGNRRIVEQFLSSLDAPKGKRA